MIMHEIVKKEASVLQPQLVEWRRALHQIPEVGIELPKTVQFIKERLTEMDIPYQSYDEYSCIVATIGQGKRCFLLRSDIDALPLQEATNLSFASTNGCMHACGHDLHGTILLGAAKILKKYEAQLNGCVKLLFQGGEETTQGAIAMVEAGILEQPKVDAGFAIHVNTMPLKFLSTGKEAMSSTYGFCITLKGKGGHGSMPEACIDPINAAVQVYLAFQSLIAREKSGAEEAVLTIGEFHAGEAPNILPVEAQLRGTLRTFSPALKERLVQRMKDIVAGVALTYRCQYDYQTTVDCTSLITDDAMSDLAIQSMQKIDSDLDIHRDGHCMFSEDFAEFSQRIPCAHFMLGAGPEDETKRYGLHDPRIEFNEDALSLGVAIYTQVAIDYLQKK